MKKISTILLAALCAGMMIAGMTACDDGGGTQQASTANPFNTASGQVSTQASTLQPSEQPSTTTSVPPSDTAVVTGTWTMNIDYTGMDEATAAQYHAQFDTVSMTMTFSDGGTMTTHAVNTSTGATNDTTGSWSYSGTTLTLNMQDGSQSTFSYQNGTLRCLDDDSTMVYLTKGGSTPTPTPQPSTVTSTTNGTELVGTWTMNIDYSGMDTSTAEQYRQLFANVSMSLTLNADGSYQSSSINTSTGETTNASGTWSMAEQMVTMTGENGQTEHFTYANGRLNGVESYILYFTR